MAMKFFNLKRKIVGLIILIGLITQPLLLNLSAQSPPLDSTQSEYEMPVDTSSFYDQGVPMALQSVFDFVQPNPLDKTYGDSNFTVNAEGGAGTGLVTYELVSGPGIVDATTGEVTITGAGPILVKATKAADIDNSAEEAILTINVAKADLIATTTNQTSVYGGTIPALPLVEVTGFVLGETESTADGYNAPVISYTNVPDALANAGPYGYTISGGGATNYNFIYDTTKRLLITRIMQPALTFATTSITKTYGDVEFTNPISGGGGTGELTFESSDTNKATVDNTGQVTIKGAGAVVITASKVGDINYANMATETYVLTINKKNLTATADNKTKNYLEANPTLTFRYTGFVLGDDISKLTGIKPTVSTTATTDSPVGNYPISINIIGATDANYKFVKGLDATLTVAAGTQPDLTFGDTSVTKTYGDDDFTNILSGGAGTGALTFESSNLGVAEIDEDTGLVTIKGAGTATITATKLGDANFSNTVSKTYTITVNKKDLTVTADNKTKNYLEANPALTLGYTGFATGDDVSKLTGIKPTASTTAVTNSPVGTYPITVDITGATDDNYNFIKGVDSILTVGARTQPGLTFWDASVTKTYGDDDFTNTLSGGAGIGAVTYSSSDTAKATVDATGKVTIKGAGSVIIVATKVGDTNYSNTVTKTYTLTINKATLTAVTRNETMVAGQSLPVGSVTVTGFKYADTESTAKGYEIPKVAYTTNGAASGIYIINANGGEAEDYIFTYTSGTLTVSPAPVPEPEPVPAPVPPGEPEPEPGEPPNLSKQLIISKTGSSEGGKISKIKGENATVSKMENEELKISTSTVESISETVTTTSQGGSPTKVALPVVSNIATTLIMSMAFITMILRKRYLKETLKKQINSQENKPLRRTLTILAAVLIVGQIGTYIYGISNLDNVDIVVKVNTVITIGTVLLGVTYIGIYQSIIRQIELYKRMI